MAKGNLFQGMARGKVGDVVLSRLDGQQIARVRNRQPRNPRTNAQLYQRAIMATIMAAYSEGKEIFDHAFENVAVGAACQRHFMSVNTKLLRKTIADEVTASTVAANCVGKVTAPKVKAFVPNALIISQGSLPRGIIVEYALDGGIVISSANVNETIAEYCLRKGVVAGDTYTYVVTGQERQNVLYGDNDGDWGTDKVFGSHFGWVRLIVKESALSSTTVMRSAKWGDLFEVTVSGICSNSFANSNFYTDEDSEYNFIVSGHSLIGEYSMGAASYGVIHSVENTDLRSNTTMKILGKEKFGLTHIDLLKAWKSAITKLDSSDLILEGGE